MDTTRLRELSVGTIIPKPDPKGNFEIKGWGQRRGGEALIYTIPNHKNPAKPYEKGIALTEFRQAYDQLQRSGELSRRWFNANMPGCAKEGGCNFTTIGGIFQLMGYANYKRGLYTKI
jgi:hypothetical protein